MREILNSEYGQETIDTDTGPIPNTEKAPRRGVFYRQFHLYLGRDWVLTEKIIEIIKATEYPAEVRGAITNPRGTGFIFAGDIINPKN